MASYHIENGNSACAADVPWAVIDDQDGGVEGCYGTQAEAQAAIDDLMVNADQPEPSSGPGQDTPGPGMDNPMMDMAFSAVAIVEGVQTSDGRVFDANAVTWRNPPLPLMAQFSTATGHHGAMVVGRIDSLARVDNKIIATGMLDSSPVACEAARLIAEQMLQGVSVDLGHYSAELEVLDQATDSALLRYHEAEIIGLTITPFPAFADTPIALTAAATSFGDLPLGDRGAAWDSGAADKRVRTWAGATDAPNAKYAKAFFWVDSANKTNFGSYKLGFADVVGGKLVAMPRGVFAVAAVLSGSRGGTNIPQSDQDSIKGVVARYYDKMAKAFNDKSIVAPWKQASLVAAIHLPARDWFDDPQLDCATPLTVTEAGQVFGHIALWEACHIGREDVCVKPPHSAAAYAYFLTGEVQTDNGPVATGPITVGTGHAAMTLGHKAAVSHYDDTGTAAVDVTCGEDAFGIWVAGSVRPSTTDEQVYALRASPPSGDWRRIGNGLELVAVLAVNTPGFPVTRGLVADGTELALVAAGPRGDCGCGCHESTDMANELATVRDELAQLHRVVGRLGTVARDKILERMT